MKRKHVPIRTCIGCHQRRPKGSLLRFVSDGKSLHIADRGGRGFYLCREISCVEKARGKRNAGRFLRRGLTDIEAARFRQAVMEQNRLDGDTVEHAICSEASGGGAVA